MKDWTNHKPQAPIEPLDSWYVGGCRVTKYGPEVYYTYYKGERANNGTVYKTLWEAQNGVVAWACNQAINDLRDLGIDHGIVIPNQPPPAKPECSHRCYTCGKPMVECK